MLKQLPLMDGDSCDDACFRGIHRQVATRVCQTLKVHPSGYYAWLAESQSTLAKEDQRLLGLIKHVWLESGGVYG